MVSKDSRKTGQARRKAREHLRITSSGKLTVVNKGVSYGHPQKTASGALTPLPVDVQKSGGVSTAKKGAVKRFRERMLGEKITLDGYQKINAVRRVKVSPDTGEGVIEIKSDRFLNGKIVIPVQPSSCFRVKGELSGVDLSGANTKKCFFLLPGT